MNWENKLFDIEGIVWDEHENQWLFKYVGINYTEKKRVMRLLGKDAFSLTKLDFYEE